jgi:hypothetical protein
LAGFLFDENLPPQLAEGLRICGLDTRAIGDGVAPPRGSSDADNVAWCLDHGYALVTIDRGRKNREITDLLTRHTNLSLIHVDRRLSTRDLLYAFVRRHQGMETGIDRCLNQGGSYRRRLGRGGGLERM